jgi:hypothetical protein
MIDPQIILWGTTSFLVALALHILIWRGFHPPREMALLIIIFLIFPGLIYFTLFIISISGGARPECFLGSLPNLIFTFIWHAAFSCAYIMTYPPIQAGCPSLKIMLVVSASMPDGMEWREIELTFSKEALLLNRIEDLKKDGLLTLKYDIWGISGTGRLISWIFINYRRLLNLPLGEG